MITAGAGGTLLPACLKARKGGWRGAAECVQLLAAGSSWPPGTGAGASAVGALHCGGARARTMRQAPQPQEANSFSPELPLQCHLPTKLNLQLTGKETHVRAQAHFRRAGKEGELGPERRYVNK